MKEKFWSDVDEVKQSIPRDERMVTGADFSAHVGEGNRGDEEVMGWFGIQDRNAGQTVTDFSKKDGNDCSEYSLLEQERT